MVTKEHILAEIVRTTNKNGGAPLGAGRFRAETGIKTTDWLGRYWARWGDALREAGFRPNTLQEPYAETYLLEKLASLTRELGHFPGRTEIQLKRQSDTRFPTRGVFMRLGNKAALKSKLARFVEGRAGCEDIAALCLEREKSPEGDNSPAARIEEDFGFVYLMRSGRFYKIGFSKRCRPTRARVSNPASREGIRCPLN